MDAIYVENVFKQYNNGVEALNSISLNVEKGKIFSLLGKNGAGKSTLIKILTTYIKPTSGIVKILGNDVYKESKEIRKHIACVSQKISIDTYLSLEENMMFQSKLYKIPKYEAEKRMKTLIECFELERYLAYPVSSYSGGVKRRLDIALNLMSNPQILFLDETTVGMDIQSRMAMWKMMKKIRNEFNTTIFFTTHYLDEADKLSDTICIIKNGQEVIQGTPNKLRDLIKQNIITIKFKDKTQAKECLAKLRKLNDYNKVFLCNEQVVIHSKDTKKEFTIINQWLIDMEINFEGIEIVKPTLDDVFLKATETNGLEEI
ncbi:ATP-binding cassette domain-containing protein [Eubacterium multiforme]|uniref:ABC-2 type transport system ATP-binding protein n=1 Tax=Eubacterium multiforme TaxID=83339 RepID=A0ABT9UVD0_9FIRM|nr:ABC transporter ATP-binding protein [Eubacterium multiforme]MDQ0150265.1 ABC-2 type transport system ATP-binding protein [Eubacterium multiforme]